MIAALTITDTELDLEIVSDAAEVATALGVAAEMRVDLIKWMVGTGLGIAAVTTTSSCALFSDPHPQRSDNGHLVGRPGRARGSCGGPSGTTGTASTRERGLCGLVPLRFRDSACSLIRLPGSICPQFPFRRHRVAHEVLAK